MEDNLEHFTAHVMAQWEEHNIVRGSYSFLKSRRAPWHGEKVLHCPCLPCPSGWTCRHALLPLPPTLRAILEFQVNLGKWKYSGRPTEN